MQYKPADAIRYIRVSDQRKALFRSTARYIEQASCAFNGLVSSRFSTEQVFVLEEETPCLFVVHDDHHAIELKPFDSLMRIEMCAWMEGAVDADIEAIQCARQLESSALGRETSSVGQTLAIPTPTRLTSQPSSSPANPASLLAATWKWTCRRRLEKNTT
jgi:hypothetical protein